MALRRAAHVAWRRVGDETVLIHLRDKKIYVLNESGGFFWHSLDGDREAGEMLGTIALPDPLPDNASDRLEAFFSSLEEADLVEPGAEADVRSPGLAPAYPLPSFVPPELVWQEELRNFGQSCAFIGGSSPACDAVPFS